MQAVIMPDEVTSYPLRVRAAAGCRTAGDCATQYQIKTDSGDWLRVWVAVGEGHARFYITQRGTQRTVQLIGRWKEGPTNYTRNKRI